MKVEVSVMQRLTKENMDWEYWMENEDWYEYSDAVKDNEWGIRLTEIAPERAKKSFEIWVKNANRNDEF
jgi:hypothetical protein